MNSRCHLCGSPEVEADSPMGSPTCADCRPIREHVVSNRTGPNGSALAVCPCGWTAEAKGNGRLYVRETQVRLHWRDVIRRKVAEFEGEFGTGSAARDLAAGALIFLFLGCDLVGLLIFVDALTGARV